MNAGVSLLQPARPRRRWFGSAYKREIIAEYDRLAEENARDALLARENLDRSYIRRWKRAQADQDFVGEASRAGSRRSVHTQGNRGRPPRLDVALTIAVK